MDKEIMAMDAIKYQSKSAKSINTLRSVLCYVDIAIGIILFILFFDDYEMRFVYGIVFCVLMVLSGLITKLVSNCFSIVTENHFRQLNVKNEEKTE